MTEVTCRVIECMSKTDGYSMLRSINSEHTSPTERVFIKWIAAGENERRNRRRKTNIKKSKMEKVKGASHCSNIR